MELLDRTTYYRAFQTHDVRFDGRVFVGVTSTGIYCRPVCPARTPKLENCRFFASAAAAQEAGFRPCLRCRPEIAPDLAFWRGTANTVNRALALIADGALDGEEADVERLAERLGVGGRQLRRLFQRHLGASPIAVAQTRRVLFAKQLLHDTRLSMAEVALASGFGSVRRFNETFRKLFGRPPGALRRKTAAVDSSGRDGVTLRLAYRPPYDWPGMLAALAARAVAGTEWIEDDVWHRRLAVDGNSGTVAVTHLPERSSVLVTIRFPSVRALPGIVARVRRVFDLGADIATIGSHLARDPKLAPLIAQRPGLRAPAIGSATPCPLRARTFRRCGSPGTPTPPSISGWPAMAEPLCLKIDRLQTPIDELLIVADEAGRLRAMDWTDHEARLRQLLDRAHGRDGYRLEPAHNRGGLTEVMRAYFEGEISVIDGLAVEAPGTPFQKMVWQELRKIGGGTTISYAELARRIGKPKAVRAAGLANGQNPISVVVPCHRVIGSDGTLTGYGGGLPRKRWLLQHEGAWPRDGN